MSKDKFTPEERKILAQNPLNWTAKLFLAFTVLYSYVVFKWIMNDPDFLGFRIPMVFTLFLFLFCFFWSLVCRLDVLLEEIPVTEAWKSYRKLSMTFVIIIPIISMGIHQKIAVLFVNTENHVKNLSTATVEMKHWEGMKANRITASWSGYYLYVIGGQPHEFWTGRCSLSDLKTMHTCGYAQKENEGKKFTVKYIDKLNYPLHHEVIIYEIKALDGSYHRDVDYHLQLYARNKRYILYYLFLVHILPMFFIYIAYVLTFKHLSNHTED